MRHGPYHRAIALLAAGISVIPGFVRDLDTYEQLVLPGMLPQKAYLGDRPPRRVDFLEDAVSAEVQLPAQLKMLVIQALELNPIA